MQVRHLQEYLCLLRGLLYKRDPEGESGCFSWFFSLLPSDTGHDTNTIAHQHIDSNILFFFWDHIMKQHFALQLGNNKVITRYSQINHCALYNKKDYCCCKWRYKEYNVSWAHPSIHPSNGWIHTCWKLDGMIDTTFRHESGIKALIYFSHNSREGSK